MTAIGIVVDHCGVPASRIGDRHWQSGFPMPFEDLPKHGIDLVVLAARDAQPTEEDLTFIRTKCPGLSIIVCPFDDTTDRAALPGIVKIATGVAARVAQRINEGKEVLITCAAGLNRSGLISGLVLVERYGISGKEAADRVRAARPGALSNAVFREYLESVPGAAT